MEIHLFREDLEVKHKLFLSICQYLDYFIYIPLVYIFEILTIPWYGLKYLSIPTPHSLIRDIRRCDGIFTTIYINVTKLGNN